MIFLMASVLFIMSGMMMMMSIDLIVEFNLFDLSSSSIIMMFFIDWKSLLFMSFVLYISSLIMNYSSEYMFGDLTLNRFLYLMLLFVFSMMMMILSLNLVSILLGWDGLGLVSYALVIYYQNVKSYNAGMLTALSNRVGDAALLMSIAYMSIMGSWNFLFYLFINENFMIMVISGFCILAAFTKSAQIPFSSWLPAAMAAPTPVSALVHSSTLVTAGVYLLIRSSIYFNDLMMSIILFLSLFTMFMAGLCANFEFDLKKIIALSTLSQLGMMLTILSLGGQDLAFFHLLTHALFKALLFMCAGIIIHTFSDTQDIRLMGGLINWMPVTCICMNISNMALCGIPFLSGFYSKDLIAEILSMDFMSNFIYLMFYISIGLTVSYSVRLSYFVFFGESNCLSLSSVGCENNRGMIFSMIGLIFFVIFMGASLCWLIEIIPYFIILPVFMKFMTLLLIILGLILGSEFSMNDYYYKLLNMNFMEMTIFMSGMWNLPVLSTLGSYKLFFNYGKYTFSVIEMGWFEFYGSSGLIMSLIYCVNKLQFMVYNHMKMFMFIFILYMMVFCIL
uniref:NADH-ubiquinone oxidoreductase chain 5 n=1 Tax=Scolytinae sp. BMNH 1039996 TaxID=1903774 RepID=A0A343A509_9CUCU|nr:NADH dehydrogenase subunit 5 [Scolytinae sp. BMNH 1039996]